MARTIATFSGGPSRGALIGEQAGQAFQQAFQDTLGQRQEEQRLRAEEARQLEQLRALGEPLTGAMQGTGNPFLQALPPEMLARLSATPQGAAMLAQSAQPAAPPPLEGPARELSDLIRLQDMFTAQGRTGAADRVSDMISQQTGQEPGTLQRNLEFLQTNAGLTPGTPEYQQAAMQLAGVSGSPVVVEGIGEDGSKLYGIVDRTTGQMTPVEGIRPKPSGRELTAELARTLAGEGPPAPGERLIPEDVDIAAALGPGGFVRNAANVISEMTVLPSFLSSVIRGDALPARETSIAREALNNLQTVTTIFLQENVPGRPSQFLLERLERLTVQPGQLTVGPERALDRFDATRRLISTERQRMMEELTANPALTDRDVQSIIANASSLERLEDAYSTIVNQLLGVVQSTPQGAPGAIPEGASAAGVTPEMWSVMTEQERALFME